MNKLSYFFGAYFVFLLATFFYLFTIERRQKSVRETLEKLEHEIEKIKS